MQKHLITYFLEGEDELGGHAGHTANIVRNKMYLFGGAGDHFKYHNDMWCLDLMELNMKWEKIPKQPNSVWPKARQVYKYFVESV